MNNIDFSRLNASSFERLATALCFQAIGIRGSVFPSGPDGARDFCYEGKVELLGWSGYVVVQAKFKENSETNSDVAWITRKIREEAAKYSTRSIRKPEYYILVTNVALSGADSITTKSGKPTIGGLQRANNELDIFARSAGIKDYQIWPRTKIEDLLSNYPSIRQSFAAWITPGDVLARLFESLPLPMQQFESIIRKSLRNGLRRDRFARLKDAGDVNDPQIRTSQVFVDLPFSWNLTNEEVEQENKLVSAIVARAGNKFNSDILVEGEGVKSKDQPNGSKVVILGGPGQGKSTASLFAAQLFRSAILCTAAENHCDTPTKQLCEEILARAKAQNIAQAITLRYPLFISLPKFADDLSAARQKQNPLPSLIGHIAKELAALSDHDVEPGRVRDWLSQYPWLLILDGLDEVPPSGERAQILEAIARLEGEVSDVKADAFIIVTTRPQGYNDDLSAKDWEHWTLSDLKISDALAYGNALGFARYAEDEQRRTEVFKLLQGATENPATARLMISPLQVTIMHMIVDTGGGIPTARWSLFNEYFEVLRKREKSKGGENQKILEKNWSHLGPIHQRAGLVLQTDSEKSGGAESYLTQQRFYRLVKAYFESIGDDAADSDVRCQQLVDVALHRLVLLSARDEGRITFDVRSMQEYMAAGALTSGAPKSIENRLLHISRASHWRHVSLIAASRCFAEDVLHHLRNTVASIPRQIETSGLDGLAKTGAKFALDLFVDGIGTDHPFSRKLLARHALELLVAPSDRYDDRLLKINEPACEDVLKAFLIEQLAVTKPGESAVWIFALNIANSQGGVYQQILRNAWPTDGRDALPLVGKLPMPMTDEVIGASIVNAIRSSDPMGFISELAALSRKCKTYKYKTIRNQSSWSQLDLRLNALSSPFHPEDYHFSEPGVQVLNSPMRLLVRGPNSEDSISNELDFGAMHEGWTPFLLASEYNKNPTSAKLGKILGLSSIKQTKAHFERAQQTIPWPLSAIWELCSSSEELALIKSAIRTSSIKDKAGREKILSKWMGKGVLPEELARQNSRLDNTLGIITDTPLLGSGLQITTRDSDTCQNFQLFCKSALEKSNPAVRKKMRLVAAFSTVAAVEFAIPKFPGLPEFLEEVSRDPACCFSSLLGGMTGEVWLDDDCAGYLGKIAINAKWLGDEYKFDLLSIAEALNRIPSNRGLLVAILLGFAHQAKVDPSILQRIDSHLSPVAGDQSRVAASAHVLRALKGSSKENLPRSLIENQRTKDYLIFVLVRLSQELDPSIFEMFAPTMVGIRGTLFHNSEHRLITAVEQNLAKRKSDLEKPGIWLELLAIWPDAFEVLRKSETTT